MDLPELALAELLRTDVGDERGVVVTHRVEVVANAHAVLVACVRELAQHVTLAALNPALSV